LKIYRLLCCALGIVFVGCQDGGSPGEIHFSSDKSTVAYTFVKRIDLPLPPEMPTLYSTVYLKWCLMDQLDSCQSLKIDSYGKSYGSFVQGQFRLIFSPDSRRIAVNSPRHLEIVELGTRIRHRLTLAGESVFSMGWLGNKEIVYTVHLESMEKNGSYYRTRKIFRHRIDDSPEKRLLLYEQNDYKGLCHEFVSPTGEYVLFMSKGYNEGIFSLLDVQTGQVTALTEKKAKLEGVSWKPDGNGVFCLSSNEALLLYPKENRIIDLSSNYNSTFRCLLEYAPKIDPLWTPDGRFIVMNSSKTGGCLVRPDPWEVIPAGKNLVTYLEEEKRQVYFDQPNQYPWIFVQPFPGWVRVWIRLRTNEKPYLPGQTVVLSSQNYLVDYKGKRFFPMKPSDSPGGAWTMTPDGKNMVYFERSIFLKINPIYLSEHVQ